MLSQYSINTYIPGFDVSIKYFSRNKKHKHCPDCVDLGKIKDNSIAYYAYFNRFFSLYYHAYSHVNSATMFPQR